MNAVATSHAVVAACFILVSAIHTGAGGATTQRRARQTAEAVEAYRVCEQFEHLLGENLDFERAFEATFTRNAARRRALAIADGEFGHMDYERIDDATLVNAYKKRMQILYLMLPLVSPASEEEYAMFFPPEVSQILKREPPGETREFPAYAAQLTRDAAYFRSHIERLAARYPPLAERLRKFKAERRAVRYELPAGHRVEPLRGYYRSGMLGANEAYYRIEGYTVAREGGRMKIVGIQFMTRLF